MATRRRSKAAISTAIDIGAARLGLHSRASRFCHRFFQSSIGSAGITPVAGESLSVSEETFITKRHDAQRLLRFVHG
jgi:hypothetical protein